uniref:Uncharacterized protein n=1 Tax=Ananas comosus var. bracteatus TaxID=296719 RepID=A0A6V7P9Q9_ANACO|nr:unnamed protein product [Ananas comosus var. bracteatus]
MEVGLSFSSHLVRLLLDADDATDWAAPLPSARPSSSSPFRPSVAVIVGVLTTMFSLTFLLLLYAKHCKRGVGDGALGVGVGVGGAAADRVRRVPELRSCGEAPLRGGPRGGGVAPVFRCSASSPSAATASTWSASTRGSTPTPRARSAASASTPRTSFSSPLLRPSRTRIPVGQTGRGEMRGAPVRAEGLRPALDRLAPDRGPAGRTGRPEDAPVGRRHGLLGAEPGSEGPAPAGRGRGPGGVRAAVQPPRGGQRRRGRGAVERSEAVGPAVPAVRDDHHGQRPLLGVAGRGRERREVVSGARCLSELAGVSRIAPSRAGGWASRTEEERSVMRRWLGFAAKRTARWLRGPPGDNGPS